ncbi:MAG: NADH-quinone oxidoreductase subunit C [Chloroflexota bacterium]|nr:NADH-quinone oxidoreductase subunit C [Chloroflexota bacterium]
MQAKTLLDAFGEACPDQTFEARTMPVDETVIEIPAACLEEVVAVLSGTFSVHHLSTITGQDRGAELELLYHFWHGQGVTLQVVLPRDDARIRTLTDVIPGADFYEREVGEMLGVTFEGHPGPEHLLLPDDWEEGPPMLKGQSDEESET